MNTKNYLILFTSIFLCNVTFAQQNQTTIPLLFDTGNPAPYGLPSTIMVIQGREVPVIFDTGAKKAEITLSPYALKYLQVNYTGEVECFNAVDGKYCGKVFVIPEIKLGDFVIKNVKGTVMEKLWGGNNHDFQETEASRNGVIGFALLSKFNLLLDYPKSKALLIKRGKKPLNYDINNWTSIPFTGHLNTRLLLNGKLKIMSWDTGALPSVIRKSANDKITPCPGDAPYSRKNDCSSIITTTLTTENNKALPNTWFMIADLPSTAPFDGLMGANFYSENLVYFDFDKKLISVASANNVFHPKF